MKTLWTIIALMSFTTISLLGIFLMPYDGSSHDMACFASLINGAKSPCPENDPLGFANFHNNAMSKISSLIPIESASILVIAIGLILSLFLMFRFADGNTSVSVIAFEYSLETKSFSTGPDRLSWFSLHENSPSLV